MSPSLSPSPRKRRRRAKTHGNHNPRVGGSSPSSGIRLVGHFFAPLQGVRAESFRPFRPQRSPANPWASGVSVPSSVPRASSESLELDGSWRTGVKLDDAQIALAALQSLRGPDPAAA